MNLCALDLSLSCTGVATNYGGEPHVTSRKPPAGLRGVHRLRWWREWVTGATEPADVVIIEGYAFARANQAHQIGELGGVIRLALDDAGKPWVALAPKWAKRLATGKGNAKKEAMLAEAIRRLGYQGASHDEADARWLLEAGLQHYGLPGAARLPKAHTEGLARVEWPG